MTDIHANPPIQHRRTIRYIDFRLQKRLLIALVALEWLMLCVAGAVLYYRLHAIVDENLYRIHIADQPPIFHILFTESMQIVAALVAINLLALLAADRIWAHYVTSIMSSLRRLFVRSQALDFGPDTESPLGHKVIELALAWRAKERERLATLHELAARAEAAAAADEVEEWRACLVAMRAQLPIGAEDGHPPQQSG